jgi:DNA-binding beta-propeller fold protein YncE
MPGSFYVGFERELITMMNTRSVHTYLASILRFAVSFLYWLPVLLMVTGMGICPEAQAQTAHFSGAQISLGGGFSAPRGVAVDSSGNVYVADSAHSQVKEIPAGCFSQACTQQLGGNYGFNSPKGMAVDAGGNVYVADSSNNKIEVMTPNCTDSSCVTQLGTGYGFNGPTAVAVDAVGNVFVADYGKSTVEEMTPGCHNSGCVTVIGSGWSQPDALAVDASGNVYVSDDNRSPVGVYEITAVSSYTTVSQIAVGFSFSSPRGVALDSAGNMFVSDAGLNAVEEITYASGYATVITLASNYSSPRGVAVDASDNVYIGDYGNNAVEEVKRSNASFGTVNIGSTSASPITLIFGFDAGGIVQAPAVLTQGMAGLDFAAASGGTCTAGTYSVNNTCTVNVSFAPQGSGTRYGAAVLRNSSGAAIATAYVYGTGVGPQVAFLPSVVSQIGSGVSDPHGIQADASGNLYVADTGANEIVESLAPGYGTLNVLGGGFSQPRGVAVDGAGNVFVGDGGNRAVKEIPPGCASSACVVTLGGGFNFEVPYGVAVDGNGNLFVNDYSLSKVYEIPAAGGYTTVIQLASSFSFDAPYGIAVDSSGNVFLADEANNAVREILAAGGYTTVETLGSGFSMPRDVAVDGSGNVFVADGGSGSVKEILAPGGYVTVQTLGSGYATPEGVAVDGAGNVYDAIAGYSYLLKEGYSGAPTFTFNATNVGSLSMDSPQSVTLLNNGNAALLIPVPASGTNPSFSTSSYSLDGATTCPVIGYGSSTAGSLAVGASCTYAVDFIPQATTNNDALVLMDNNLNAAGPGYTSQSITLNGVGNVPAPVQTTPTITWTPPATINFGSDLTSVLTAVASVPGSFTYTATPAGGTAATVTTTTILTPASYTLNAAFTPTDLVDYTTATATAPLTVNANFGGVDIGSPSATPMTVTFTLPGTPGNGILAVPLVLTQGAAGLDFTDAGTGSCTAGTMYSGAITCTVGVTFTPKYAGTRYGAVVLTDSAGTVVATQYIIGTGTGPQVNFLPGVQSTVSTSSLIWPFGAAVDAGGNLYIADSVNNRILKETPTSGSYSESTIAGGLLSSPEGVAVDGAGNVYIADSGDGQVLMAPWTGSGYGTPVTVANSALNGLYGPEGVAVDGAGNVYVADTGNSRVLQFPWTGNGYGAAVTVANATLNGLSTPDGVAVDGSGNVYVADTGNSQVLQFPWTGSGYGTPVTVANSALNGLSYPYGIAVDGLGNVYIADTYKGRVVKETLSGASYTQSVVASGLDDPEGVAVDGSGNVYLTNSGIGVLLKEDFADAPAVTFPTPTVAGSADTTDGAQIVTLENVGNQPLTFSALTYPADFPETGSNDCSMSAQLAAGASCPLTMHFVPASNGPIADFLVLGDNALNSPGSTQTITLNGTGVSVFAKFGFAGLPASLALGTPQAMILTAENSSGATLTSYTGTAQLSSSDPNAVFSLSSGGAPIASYTFIPSDGGVRSLYVTFETAGSQSIMATDAVAGVSSSSGGVLLSQTTPTITWLQPLAIGYGVALSSTQLNATASVAGTFTYTPAAGSVLNAGGQTLSVVFTPTDGINYSTANGSVSLTVNKAPATVIPDAGTKTYGTSDAVLTGTLSGFLAADNVSATYSRAVGETVAGGPYTISATLNPVGVLGNYNIAYNTANFTITKALLTVTASNASMLYGAVPPNLGGTMVGVVAGDGITASFTTAATSSSQPGPYAITPVLSDPNGKLGNYNEVFNDGTLTIGTDTTTTTVQTSAATVLAQNNVTFTAKVSGAASTPAGSVSFLDGGTALGTAPLDNTGSATLTLSTLSVGAHNITAVYAGNVDFVGSASSAITETVQDFNFTISGAAVTVLSATVEPGSTAVYTLQLTPTSGATFAGTVALTLTGVPAGATYTVTPSSIAEGSGITTVTVTVNIPKQQPGVSSPSPKDSDGLPKPLLMVLFLPLLGMGKVRRALRARMKSPVLMLAMLGVLMAAGMTACGSGSGSLTQPPQSSAMMLTGTSGGLHHSITLNLTVQ